MLKSGKSTDRRYFITKSLSLLLPASAISQSNLEGKDNPPQKEQLMTSDGKLVEVDKSVLNKLKADKASSNKDILDWITLKT